MILHRFLRAVLAISPLIITTAALTSPTDLSPSTNNPIVELRQLATTSEPGGYSYAYPLPTEVTTDPTPLSIPKASISTATKKHTTPSIKPASTTEKTITTTTTDTITTSTTPTKPLNPGPPLPVVTTKFSTLTLSPIPLTTTSSPTQLTTTSSPTDIVFSIPSHISISWKQSSRVGPSTGTETEILVFTTGIVETFVEGSSSSTVGGAVETTMVMKGGAGRGMGVWGFF